MHRRLIPCKQKYILGIRQYFSFHDAYRDLLSSLRLQYNALWSHGNAFTPKSSANVILNEDISFDDKLPRCKFINGRYLSPWTKESDKKTLVIINWLISRMMNESPEKSFEDEMIKNPKLKAMSNPYRTIVEPIPVNLSLLMHPQPNRAQFTWMGHSSCYYQVHGLNIMTDPIWSDRCSPFTWIGPLRAFPPPIDVKRLAIDVVLISHTHYDHLDAQTVDMIGNRALW